MKGKTLLTYKAKEYPPNAIEKELTKVSSFAPSRDYAKRQDYLAALTRNVDQYFASVKDEGFDDLTTEAAEWFNAAARAISNKKVIPEFDAEVDSAEAQVPEADDPPLTDEELAEEPADGPALPVRKEHPPKAKRHYDSSVPPGLKLPHLKIKGDGTSGRKNKADVDKFGFSIGSKNSAAAAMFEQGCRMIDVKASLGANFYAVVNKCIGNGHKVEHEANRVIRVTYRGKPGKKTQNDAT